MQQLRRGDGPGQTDGRTYACQYCGAKRLIAVDAGQIAEGISVDLSNISAFLHRLAHALETAVADRTKIQRHGAEVVSIELNLAPDVFVAKREGGEVLYPAQAGRPGDRPQDGDAFHRFVGRHALQGLLRGSRQREHARDGCRRNHSRSALIGLRPEGRVQKVAAGSRGRDGTALTTRVAELIRSAMWRTPIRSSPSSLPRSPSTRVSGSRGCGNISFSRAT